MAAQGYIPPSIAHPLERQVAVCGGTMHVLVRPWTLAQRAALRPRLAELVQKVATIELPRPGPNGEPAPAFDLGALFLVAEDEIYALVQASVALPVGVEWGQLWWEDVANLAQAVWEVTIVRPDGGGVAGKLAGVLGRGLRTIVEAQRHARASAPAAGVSPPSPMSPPS